MRFFKRIHLPKLGGCAAKTKLKIIETGVSRFLYVVGIQTVRILKRVCRRGSRFFRPAANLCRRLYAASIGAQISKLKLEIHSIKHGFSVAKKRIAKAKSVGFQHAVKELFTVAGKSLSLHKNFLFSILNVAVPLISIFLLVSTVNYWSNLDYNLILENCGKQIAVIQNESTYEKATELVSQRMVHDNSEDEAGVTFAPNFKLSVANGNYSTAAIVCDKLIQQSNGIIEEASGLYVDGELMGVVKSSADMRYMLQSLLNSDIGGEAGVTAKFTQNVETVNGLFPTTSIVSTEDMKKIIFGKSKAARTYTVQDGDTVTSIAKNNSTTIKQLNKINNNKLGDSIHAGDLIKLEVAVPKLSVELLKTVTYEVPLPYNTVTKNDDSNYTDYSKIITEGVNGTQKCIDAVYTVNGVEIKRENLSTATIKSPVDKVVLTGTKKRAKDSSGVSSGSLMWPVPSLHTITTYFTWRWGQFHYGIDISGSSAYGKTIVAADGGVVTEAGYNAGGYGNCVIINHGNGLVTVYAHASKVLVSAGQRVSKGQAIARVGSTGNSTGAHCHFEVRKNGTKVNPLKYVSQ